MTSVKSDLLAGLLQRRSFAGLMELYESNSRLLKKLIPDLEGVSSGVSKAKGSPDLHLKIEERCKFTTTLSLTYYFENAKGELVADPDLQVRIYHDARLAEAVSCNLKGFMSLGGKRFGSTALACKWDSNLFLRKWLEYSLGQGHGFGHQRQDEEQLETTTVEAL
jgi:uncharacterized protein YqiB (DUF1249 family)